MRSPVSPRAALRVVDANALAIAMAMALCIGSCAGDTTSTSSSETDVAIMRLSVANQQITVDQTGSVTGGPAVLRAGIPVTVTAVFLTVTGETDPRVVRATYQLNASVVGSDAWSALMMPAKFAR